MRILWLRQRQKQKIFGYIFFFFTNVELWWISSYLRDKDPPDLREYNPWHRQRYSFSWTKQFNETLRVNITSKIEKETYTSPIVFSRLRSILFYDYLSQSGIYRFALNRRTRMVIIFFVTRFCTVVQKNIYDKEENVTIEYRKISNYAHIQRTTQKYGNFVTGFAGKLYYSLYF